MASALKLSTIKNQDGSKEVPSETVIAGSAKAWVNFNGTGTIAIRDSFNVSSITDNGVGIYTVNFTNDMPNTNYAISSMAANGSTTFGLGFDEGSYSVSSVTGRVVDSTGIVSDSSNVAASVFSN